jgi:S-(hydroxymethyl)glutathione dehydrogenase / alcohol dehydrogenase
MGETLMDDTRAANGVSRRDMLKTTAAAVGGAAALGTAAAAAQAPAPATTAGLTPSQSGQRFRGYVRFGTGASVQELKLLPIAPRQVVVRTEASQICYSTTTQGLAATPAAQAVFPAHGGVGTVIEVGSHVDRVQVGDRVIVAGQAQCGSCYHCLRGRADHCLMGNAGGDPNRPVAEMRDGTKVAGFRGGCAELMVTFEDYCVPVVTKVSSVELAALHDTGMVGLAATMTKVRIEPGTDAVILGCGPIGLSAVQGARIQGAAQIIAVEPIRYRREAALKVGATIALDPNVEGDNLIPRIRELCRSRTKALAGGGNTLPDFVLECVGGDLFPPKAERGPDPTGLLSLQQAWQLCSPVGHVVTTGVGHPPGAMISFPAGQWSNSAKSHHPGNVAGASSLRDLPRFVRLIEAGLFDAKAIATATFPLERAREAFQAAADRSTVGAVIVYG